MLPPVNGAVLEHNPRFTRLYQEMVQSRLNADTSTKVIKQQRAALEVEKSLNEHKVRSAREQLLEQALEDVIAESMLPQELARATQVMLAVRSGELSASEAKVLQDDLDLFETNSQIIAAATSTQLQTTAAALTTFLPTISTDPTIAIGHLPMQTSELLSSITTQSTAIAAIRSQIADLAAQVQSAHADVLETAIRILEQTMHGSVARGIKARAEHLSLVAKGLDMKVRILAQNDPLLDSTELVEAVKAYNEQLDDTIDELKTRTKELQGEVDDYASAGRGMEQIAERYAVLLKKKTDLELELGRLRKSSTKS